VVLSHLVNSESVVRTIISRPRDVLLDSLVLRFEVIYSPASETKLFSLSSTPHILVSIRCWAGIFAAQLIHLARVHRALVRITGGPLGPGGRWVGLEDGIVLPETSADVVGAGAWRVAGTTRESITNTETGTPLF